MSAFEHRYAPGSGTAVVGGAMAVMVGLPPDHPLVPGCLAAVRRPHASLDEVLEVLVSEGLRAVSTFVIAEVGDAGVRVVVRGSHTAEVAGERVAGTGLWADRTFPAATAVTLAGDEGAATLRLPVDGGVVLASVVELARAGEAGVPAQLAAASDVASEPAPVPEARPEPEAQPEVVPEPEPQPEPEPEPSAEPEPEPELEPEPEPSAPDFDHLFGVAEVPPVAVPAPAPADVVPPVVPPASGGLFIDSFPWNPDGGFAPEAPASVPSAPAQVVPPRSEMTIDRDQLKDHGGAIGPMVVAARCGRGHLSPAYAALCRVCGDAMPPQQAFEIPRPPLGVLRLQNGDTVLLDRGAILGRNPRLPQGWTGEQPNLVKIIDPDRDVSSQHLEVRLDFWHVLVRDLGSTNGTEVKAPGQGPVTLPPHEQVAIEPGTKILLAGVVELTFEVVE